MISFATTQEEKRAIYQLKSMLINQKTLTPADIWKCLSSPKKKQTFAKGRKPAKKTIEINFSDNRVTALESLKKLLTSKLEASASKRCSYCKRPVAKYGISWHVEHILSKKNYRKLTFTKENLILSCVDCNFSKNLNLDNKSIPFDIINPNLPGFVYSDHLTYLQVSTEKIHILKYKRLSPEGEKTYERLGLKSVEYTETLMSISFRTQKFIEEVDDIISKHRSAPEKEEISTFLMELKHRILSP